MRPPLSTSPRSSRHAFRGFTLTDLLVLLAVLSILTTLVVISMVTAKRQARLAQCIANLAPVNQALLAYCADNSQTIPDRSADPRRELWWWYKEQVKPYLDQRASSASPASVFACPDDRGYTDPKPFHRNARFDSNSYVLNAVTLPGIPNIAGWRLTSIREPAKTLLAMEWPAHAPLSWHASRTGKKNQPFYCDARSVVGFVDGHVRFTAIYYDGYNAAYTRDPISGYEYKYSGN